MSADELDTAAAEIWWQIEERGEYEWHRLAGVERDETNARVGLEGLREEVPDKEFRLVRITREVVDPELSAVAAGGVQPAPAAENCPAWDYGTCRCSEQCPDAVLSAGSGSTDQPPAEVCRCAANKSPCDCWHAHISAGYASNDGAGTPGLVLCTDCGEPWHPHRTGWNGKPSAGGAGGTTPTADHIAIFDGPRRILADLANDAQDMGLYDGLRDPSCGLCHPHSPTTRCAGEDP